MKKQIFIMLTVVAGLFLMPALSYAYQASGHTMESSCCHEETSHSDSDSSKDCCEQHSHDGEEDGCGSNCDHSGCQCAQPHPVAPHMSAVQGAVSFTEKQFAFGIKVFHSSEFLSIWVPPKIA